MQRWQRDGLSQQKWSLHLSAPRRVGSEGTSAEKYWCFCGDGNALGSVTFTNCKLKHIAVAECIDSCRLQEKIHGVIFLCTNMTLQAYCSKARFIFFFLQIRNVDTNQCLDNMGRKENEKVGIFNCHGMGGNQVGMTVRR